jgi:hypothetical protein
MLRFLFILPFAYYSYCERGWWEIPLFSNINENYVDIGDRGRRQLAALKAERVLDADIKATAANYWHERVS